jgi:hypothetical protein
MTRVYNVFLTIEIDFPKSSPTKCTFGLVSQRSHKSPRTGGTVDDTGNGSGESVGQSNERNAIVRFGFRRSNTVNFKRDYVFGLGLKHCVSAVTSTQPVKDGKTIATTGKNVTRSLSPLSPRVPPYGNSLFLVF